MEKNTEATEQDKINWTARLKRDMQFFHAQTGMKLTTIGRLAIKDSRCWDRLAGGGTITLEKADLIYVWMASQGHHFNR